MALLTCAMALLTLPAFGRTPAQSGDVQPGTPFTQNEYLSLPRVCLAQTMIHKFLENPVVSEPEREQWYASMGHDYRHFHHYCWGLMQMSRGARAQDERVRAGNYRAAIAGFDYVIRAADRNFSMMPELYLRKGMALRLIGDYGAAAGEFAKSIRSKSTYTPAYAALIDLHIDLGNPEEAEAVLQAGLQNSPDSGILAKKQAELNTLHSRPKQ